MVKECRAQRPRFRRDDAEDERREKLVAHRKVLTAVNRSDTDRMELQLAAVGWNAMHYILTFAPEHLPKRFSGVRERLRQFQRAARREYRRTRKTKQSLRYVCRIEGLHEQYHIHFVCDAEDLSFERVQSLWPWGFVLPPEWVLQTKSGYRGLARYLSKEHNDGIRIPLGTQPATCSRSVAEAIPAPTRWRDRDGSITPDRGAVCLARPKDRPEKFDNGFGVYKKNSWIVPDGSPACRRALRRMGYQQGGGQYRRKKAGSHPLSKLPAADGTADTAGDQS